MAELCQAHVKLKLDSDVVGDDRYMIVQNIDKRLKDWSIKLDGIRTEFKYNQDAI